MAEQIIDELDVLLERGVLVGAGLDLFLGVF